MGPKFCSHVTRCLLRICVCIDIEAIRYTDALPYLNTPVPGPMPCCLLHVERVYLRREIDATSVNTYRVQRIAATYIYGFNCNTRIKGEG